MHSALQSLRKEEKKANIHHSKERCLTTHSLIERSYVSRYEHCPWDGNFYVTLKASPQTNVKCHFCVPTTVGANQPRKQEKACKTGCRWAQSLHLLVLEELHKQKQIRHKASRRKQIIKIRTEIDEIENKEINESKGWSLKKYQGNGQSIGITD